MDSGTAMAPWPGLSPFARRLGGEAGRAAGLFFFDSSPGDRSRKAILLLHGLGDEADSFRHLFPLLAPRFRLLAPDLPGFGRSRLSGPPRFAGCLAAIEELLDGEGIRDALVAGSSLGAALAEALAARRPELVGALALVDGGLPSLGRPDPAVLAMALPFLGARRYRAFRRDHAAAVASLEPYYADFAALPAADRAFLSARVVDRVESDTQMRAYLGLLRSFVLTAASASARFAAFLAGWAKPLAVVWGAADRIVPEVAGRRLAESVPGAAFHRVAGAGHLPHQEAPAEVARILGELGAA